MGELEHLLDTEEYRERVRVEFFTNEKSFKERLQVYFIKNQRSSLRIRLFNLFIKLLSCVLYIVRVSMDNPKTIECYPVPFQSETCWNFTKSEMPAELFRQNQTIDWKLLLWVNRNQWLWAIQVTVAIISLAEQLLLTYLGYKGNIIQQILSPVFFLEIVNTVPFIITIFYFPIRNLFVPVFLNCWLAKAALESMFNDLHRAMLKSQSALSHHMMILIATFLCLFFTSICGIQHLQRAGNRQMDLIDCVWYVIVTFSTVGYGDVVPDIWPSKVFMMLVIIAALIVLPTQVEQLAFTWIERQKQGGTYSSHRAQNEKHVVLCTTTLHADVIMDFLNEFYAHPKLQHYYVVLLSPCELDATMKMILQVPIWAARVIYIQGSALKDSDLNRCRMQEAEACFVIAERNITDRTAADQHTILRSWAVKDFAPYVPQYVQMFRPENKIHVKFAEHVVCEDEFKYALLANNCLCPGTSTLVTLLLHTSRGAEGQSSNENWMRLYGRCSGNEIYQIVLGKSKFFEEYEGKSFNYASFHAHRKYGVALVGIKQQDISGSTIQLNPGPRHLMKKTDLLFYMSITKEENTFVQSNQNQEKLTSTNRAASNVANIGAVALAVKRSSSRPTFSRILKRRDPQAEVRKDFLNVPTEAMKRKPSIATIPPICEQECRENEGAQTSEESSDDDDDNYVKGFPPVTPYIGTSPTLCHLMRNKRPLCCLQLTSACSHCSYKTATDYQWTNGAVIVIADYASNGLYNFIIPLRSHARPKKSLNPIVLLLEKKPDPKFLDTICYLPMVYWIMGSMDNLDNLLKSGINLANNVIVSSKESSNAQDEDTLSDCNTIVAVQTMHRLFPKANIITELCHANNMRFMQFRAKDSFSLRVSKMEKKEKERGSHLYYMFRLPFAAGNVFSASMLDGLLYQAFVKSYLITFIRLLLGIDQAVGSGHLSSMRIKPEDLWLKTYGRLYQRLCSTTCEIPIGIYRTQKLEKRDPEVSSPPTWRFRNSFRRSRKSKSSSSRYSTSQIHDEAAIEHQEIIQMVQSRMLSLDMSPDAYTHMNPRRNTTSYVIINPEYDLELIEDDIIYLIKPSSLSPQASPLIDERKIKEMKRQEPPGAEKELMPTTAFHIKIEDHDQVEDAPLSGTIV
ncbi:DgyrCDS858 [Dimorphilus gyrociliatus]|uniref:DgyrCDS858 n=1 Tax=Dimorphilus gyrociliatus TaxID=2664684 RepID=A0A7I8VAE3_9ANNE|nr:DgyrCDS858 [Dimorphilus gyrociliatus]